MKTASPPRAAILFTRARCKLGTRVLGGVLPLMLAGCAANDGFQLSNLSLNNLFGEEQPAPAAPSHAVADIGTTQCDRLTTDGTDPDRLPGVAKVDWHKLDAAAAIPACEQALAQYPGHRRLQAQLARAYLRALFYDEAYAVATEAAGTGSVHALYQLGLVYRDGKKDNAKAIEAFERAARAGHANAMTDLAWSLHFRDGWGDRRQAATWFQKAAETGNMYSMTSLADMYVITDKQFEKAFPWYQRAAEQGNRHALFMLGRYHALGFPPIARNPDRALPYFARAGQLNYADANTNAARLYIQKPYSAIAPHLGGGGVSEPLLEEERKEKALQWLQINMPRLSVR